MNHRYRAMRDFVQTMSDTLLERLPDLRLAVPADRVPFRQRTMIRGPEALPIAW